MEDLMDWVPMAADRIFQELQKVRGLRQEIDQMDEETKTLIVKSIEKIIREEKDGKSDG